MVIKAFEKSSNHAREMNWLRVAVERYLAVGGVLSKGASDIVVGYTTLRELREQHARNNGGKWKGGVYGINLPMGDLVAVVGWAADQYV